MISVQQAISIVELQDVLLANESLKTEKGLNKILFENIYSPIDMPPFPQSAMDGYALNLHSDSNYKIIGEIAAGCSQKIELKKGEAVRIFTGAPVPKSANAVIQQEWVTVISESEIEVQKKVEINTNIRPQGEQISKNAIALKKGDNLTPAAIGFLTGIGVSEVSVCKPPKIAVIATGDELVAPGHQLKHGEIYESNSYMLSAALHQFGYSKYSVSKLKDNFETTKSKIASEIEQNDVVIISGGISVGDYDYVGKSLFELGVETLFYKVKQKPGKPLFFGKKGSTFIFALPGNPAAALTSFYIYVLRLLCKFENKKNPIIEKEELLYKPYVKKGDRAVFLKAKSTDKGIEILEGQSSAMLKTFAEANCLVYIPSDKNEISTSEKVKVFYF